MSVNFDVLSGSLKLDTSGWHGAIKGAQTGLQSFVANIQQSLDVLKRGVDNVAKAFGGFATAAGALTAVGLKIGASYEQAMVKVKVVTNATEKEFAALGKEAERLGLVTAFSAKEAAQGMSELALQGFKAGDIMKHTESVLQLASATQTSVAESASIAAKAMNAFGIESDQLPGVLDTLAKASISGGTSMEELTMAFRNVGPVAKTMGVSIEQATAMIQLLGKAGLPGERAGSGLKMVFSNLAMEAKPLTEVMQQLGISFKNADGSLIPMSDLVDKFNERVKAMGLETSKGALLLKAFGAEGGVTAAALFDQGGAKIREYTQQLENAGGSMKALADAQLNTLEGSFIVLKSTIQGFGIMLSKSLGPQLSEIVKGFNDWAAKSEVAEAIQKKITTGVGYFTDAAKEAYLSLRMAFDYLQPAAAVLWGEVTAIWQAFQQWFGQLDPGTQAAIKAAAAATAISLAIGKIGGSLPFVGQFAAAIGALINPFTLVGGAIKFVLPLLSAGTGLIGVFTSIVGMIGAGGPLILALAALAAIFAIGGDFGGAVEGLGEMLRDVGKNGFDALKGTVEAFSAYMKGDALGALAGYHKALAGLSEIGGTLAGKAGLGGLSEAFKELAQAQRELSGSESLGSAQEGSRQANREGMFGKEGAGKLKDANDAAQEVTSLAEKRSAWKNAFWLRGTSFQVDALEELDKKLAAAIAKRDRLMAEAASVRGSVEAPNSVEDQRDIDKMKAEKAEKKQQDDYAAAEEKAGRAPKPETEEQARTGLRHPPRKSRKANFERPEDAEETAAAGFHDDGKPSSAKEIAAAKKQAKTEADARKAIRAEELAQMTPEARKKAQAADKAAEVARKAEAGRKTLAKDDAKSEADVVKNAREALAGAQADGQIDEKKVYAEQQVRDKASADYAQTNPDQAKAAATGVPPGAQVTGTQNVGGKEIPIVNVEDEEYSAPAGSAAMAKAKEASASLASIAKREADEAASTAKREAYENRAATASDKAAASAEKLAGAADDATTETEKLTEAEKEAADAQANAAGKQTPEQAMQAGNMQAAMDQAMQHVQGLFQQGAQQAGQMAQQAAVQMAMGPGQLNDMIAQAQKAGNPVGALDLIIQNVQAKAGMAKMNQDNLSDSLGSTGDAFGPGTGNEYYAEHNGSPGAQALQGFQQLLAQLQQQRAGLVAQMAKGKRIPKMAEGGIATNSIMANIGEDGPEAVIPLQKLGQVLASVLPSFGSSSIFGNVNPFGPIMGTTAGPAGSPFASTFLNKGALGAFDQAFGQASNAVGTLGNEGLDTSGWMGRLQQMAQAQQAAVDALNSYQQHSQINLQPMRGSSVVGGTNPFGEPGRGMLPNTAGALGRVYSGDTTPQYTGPNVVHHSTINVQSADLTTDAGARSVAERLVPHIDAVVKRMGTDATGASALRSRPAPYNAGPTAYPR